MAKTRRKTGKRRPKMAKMRSKLPKMRPKMAKMRPKMAKMRLKIGLSAARAAHQGVLVLNTTGFGCDVGLANRVT